MLIGRASMSPAKPSRLPHIESDRSIIAGCSPVTLFIIWGIRMLSCIS